MTDRIHSITIILDKDYRIDDAKPLIKALHQFRGVIEVKPNVSNIESLMAYSRARTDLQTKLFEVLEDK